jgi:hypothetical protein
MYQLFFSKAKERARLTGRYESNCHGLGDLELSLGLGKSGSRPNSSSESCEHLDCFSLW